MPGLNPQGCNVLNILYVPRSGAALPDKVRGSPGAHFLEHGSIDREALDKCLKTKTRNRIDEILVALNGALSVHQRRFLNMVFQHLEDLEAHKHAVEDEITEEVLKHTDALNLLCSIPGIDVTAAAAIIAEIGTDMSSFPDSQHICSWKPICQGEITLELYIFLF